MTHTIVGLFSNRSDAQTAMQDLVSAGFIQDNIDLSNRRVAEGGDNYSETNDITTGDQGIGDKISNFFSSLFGDDETTARNYTNAAHDADAILTVQVDSNDRAEEARDILDRNGAMDIDENNAQYGATYGSETDLRENYSGAGLSSETTDGSASMNTSATMNSTGTTGYDDTTRSNVANINRDTDVENREVIPVIEENLEVGKRAVERGGARIRSRVIEKPVEANVRLREEHVVVNRRPVDRAVTQADVNNFQQGDIELTERAEVPVVNKQARVVEEIEVGKQVEEREETVRDTVRRTDVDVQEIDSDLTDDDLHTGTRSARNS